MNQSLQIDGDNFHQEYQLFLDLSVTRKKANREKTGNKLSFLKCEINLVVFLF
jgi:hypothetical protein